MSSVDYDSLIPNNVDLASDRRLQRALESWQPKFVDWWKDLGPVAYQDNDVYLRTAVSVGQEGWAHFDYVRMAEYRWGIFLAEPEADRRIGFGDHLGEPVWQEVPGELRADLRRLVVVQGDTEPASVEQQRPLCMTAPSQYDLRNLFQVNVEEGRHLWAMVYLLHRYFGRDGREEAEALLERRSGDVDNPRILGAFNERTPDWLLLFMFSYFTDRDGKFQLNALAESGFDPLARSTKFMLTEEAHHMFVGESGVARTIQRTCEVMKEHGLSDPREGRQFGIIDLNTLQKFVNFHFSVTLDLFGSEISSNAATYYTTGLKGRYEEAKRKEDHKLGSDEYLGLDMESGRIVEKRVPALTALNARLRDDYIEEIQGGLNRWNRIPEQFGIPFRFKLPHVGFHRKIGNFSGHFISPDGNVVTESEWNTQRENWMPSEADHQYIESLMGQVIEPGKLANWIPPPARRINSKPIDFEYVRF